MTGIREQLRLAALHSYHVLDTEPEPLFDDMVRDLSRIARVPISVISLIDAERQWFKARHGLSVMETDRRISFCTVAVEEVEDFLIVPDATRDSRFADNPLVMGAPGIRFYAGRVLRTPLGQNIGTINIIDTRARPEVSDAVKDRMSAYAEQIVATFDRQRADRIFSEARRSVQGTASNATAYAGLMRARA